MSAIKKRNVAKIETSYTKQHEISEANLSRKRTLLFRRLAVFLIFAAVSTYFIINTLISQASTLDEMNAEKKKLHEELGALKKEETILQEEIVKLNDDDYIAKYARSEYFLSDKNEIIFNLPDEKKEKSSDKSSY
ncbi:septum formation initiator family protein [Cytobacillus sp. FJAT-54145]|uniref:Septum formation initiator family protein n=1 Tax=Cytobacillus spartinae TaxID=3299023 RepID=A0ABW6KLC2_9BACI